MKKIVAGAPALLALSLAVAPMAFGGMIVPDLDDGAAVQYTVADTDQLIDTSASVLADGLTLAVRATLGAADVAASATGAVNLLEIGGTTSGTGLFVVGGEYWFSSSSGAAAAFPSGSLDLDGSNGAIGVAIGAVTPGVEQEVFFSLDNANARLLVGLDGDYKSYDLTGVGAGWNWRGNRTVTFAGNDDTVTGTNFGFRGGQSDNPAAGAFYNMNAVNLVGTVSLGQYFNDVSAIPEPTALALMAMVVASTLVARRSRMAVMTCV